MKIRATIVLNKNQIEEMIYSLKNNERVELALDLEINKAQIINEQGTFLETPKEVYDKIKDISEKSTSYDNFVENTLDWLDLGKQRDYFKEIIRCAEKARKVTWDGIELIMLGERIHFGYSDRILTSRKINRKIRNVVNCMDIVKNVLKYSKYSFIKQ